MFGWMALPAIYLNLNFYRLGVSGAVLARLDFKLVDHLLHIGNHLGQAFGFLLLLRGLYGAGKNDGSILYFGVNALVIKILVRLDLSEVDRQPAEMSNV